VKKIFLEWWRNEGRNWYIGWVEEAVLCFFGIQGYKEDELWARTESEGDLSKEWRD